MKLAELYIMPLFEGSIKLPSKLLADLKHQLHSAVGSLARVKCSSIGRRMLSNDDITQGGFDFGLKTFDEFFQSRYPGIKLKEINPKQTRITRKIGDFLDTDLPDSYKGALEKSKLDITYEFNKDPAKPLKLILALKAEGGLKGHTGQYSAIPNTIELNLERMKAFAWDDYLETAQLVFDKNGENLLRKMNRMLEQLADRIERLEGTLEHELAHYIQFKVFSGVDRGQISFDGKSNPADTKNAQDNDKYFSSQIEFDPQIKSNAKNTITTIRMHKRERGMENLTWQDVARITVGQDTAEEIVRLKKLPSWVSLGRESDFFNSLRRVDYQQWKKAVKLFMQLVGQAFEER